MRRSCGHTRIRREQKGACSQLLGSFTRWILDEGPRPFGTPRAAPIHVELTAGQTHEATVAAALLEHADGRAFIGDTGYDAERIRAAAAARGMRVVIPSHPTRATEHRLDKKLYRDPLPHRVSVSPPQALSSARDPLRKDPGRNYLAFVPSGLRSDLDQHALMPRNCIPGTDETSGMLDHEKLDVYQRAIEFVACALRIAERLPRGQAPLGGPTSPCRCLDSPEYRRRWRPKPRVRGPRQVPRHRSRLCNGVGRFARRHSSVQRRAPRGLGPTPSLSWSASSKCSARCAEATASGTGTRTHTGTGTGTRTGAPSNRGRPLAVCGLGSVLAPSGAPENGEDDGQQEGGGHAGA